MFFLIQLNIYLFHQFFLSSLINLIFGRIIKYIYIYADFIDDYEAIYSIILYFMKKRGSLVPVGVTQESYIYSGMIYVNPNLHLFQLPEHCFPVKVRINSHIFTCDISPNIPIDKIGISKKIREFLSVNLIDPIQINLYEQPQDGYLQQLEFQVQLAYQNDEKSILQIEDNELEQQIKELHMEKYFQKDFCIPFKFNGITLFLKTIQIKNEENDYLRNNKLNNATKISFKAKEGQKIKFKSHINRAKGLFSRDFKIEEMGIGGLDLELTNIFRRAFASRRFPQSMIQKFGIQHVKGILLYGPPGTGKTLIARQLAKSLKAKQIKIVNGPEIFSKYVGESQQNIRKLFASAKQDSIKYGYQSPLHIIVFDQIDAICKQRGTINNGTNSQDLVVNQLLTNIDGVQALNNILVIGMTNRKDLIDQAVLRPGRFEVHIEVGLPNEEGRQQILKIHTKTLLQNCLLSPTVNIEHLAKVCKNFTGAEIQALVKSASSFSMTKHSNLMDFSKQLVIKEDSKVQMEDFERALQQVKPQFGVDQEKFDIYLRGKLYNYGPRYNKIQQILKLSIKMCQTGQSQLKSILLQGTKGTGKTSIASYFARNCPFPFVKLISPQQFVGTTQFAKINAIVKIFEDAYRSKEACIILDNIERLIQFVDIGPRFSNELLQTLLILLKKIPKKSQCRLLIIGTTSSYFKLSTLQICKSFNLRLNVPELNQKQIAEVLRQLKVQPTLSQQIGKLIIKISIKKLLQIKDVSIGKDLQKWKQVYNEFN